MNMRHMPRVFTAGIIILAVSIPVIAAQGTMGRRHHCKQMMERAAVKLNLTESQKTQIKGITQNAKTEAAQIKQSNIPQDQKKSRLMTLRQETKDKIGAILTPEQREKAKQMMQQHRGRRHAGWKMGVLQRLNLTPDQKEKAKAIHQTARTRVMSVRSDTSLTPTQKKEKIDAIRRVARNDFMAILTPEQRAQIQQQAPKADKRP